ncbi:MAG: serpin family protein [Bacteroidales bacterium]|jgi:serine protease inhibitor|nr:serpin family protein [Bacteroidales bacterium]OQB70971.1 MAG: Serpin (serine protease inhibitor) [Bacteroidetes bacterium ADurb.Bin139]HPB78093.1 serpin family protein [Bacteroidales bacterium]HQN82248.1 serpin family protein [Bacteroidales bacterium]
MKQTVHLVLTALLLCVFSGGCERLSQQANQRKDIILTRTEQAISAEVNRFAFDFFRQVGTEDENFFISPLSASLALSMTANGTAGATADEMKKVLGFEDFSYKDMNGFFRTMTRELTEADRLTEVGIANSIWIREGFPVRDSYKQLVKTWYLAMIEELDFSSPLALETINNWCADQTKGKIDKIINEIPPQMLMYLINALYFKGTWTKSFDQTHSYRSDFYPDQGASQMVDYMIQTETFPYTETEYARLAELPYGNQAFSMVLVLPKPGIHTDRVIKEEMNPQTWNGIVEKMKQSEKKLTISMPKFKYEYEKDLIPTLQAMGMELPFVEGAADFSNLSAVTGLYIGLVKQKTYVEINEKGTEAAAVTIVGIEKSSIGPDDPLPFTVNRSFLYIIKEKSTDVILFMGKMSFFESPSP